MVCLFGLFEPHYAALAVAAREPGARSRVGLAGLRVGACRRRRASWCGEGRWRRCLRARRRASCQRLVHNPPPSRHQLFHGRRRRLPYFGTLSRLRASQQQLANFGVASGRILGCLVCSAPTLALAFSVLSRRLAVQVVMHSIVAPATLATNRHTRAEKIREAVQKL